MNQLTKKNKKIKLGQKITAEKATVTVCLSEKFFRILMTSGKLSFNRNYNHADVTIIKNILMLSICDQVKMMFEVKSIGKESDRTVIKGEDYTIIVNKKYSDFKEEFIGDGI